MKETDSNTWTKNCDNIQTEKRWTKKKNKKQKKNNCFRLPITCMALAVFYCRRRWVWSWALHCPRPGNCRKSLVYLHKRAHSCILKIFSCSEGFVLVSFKIKGEIKSQLSLEIKPRLKLPVFWPLSYNRTGNYLSSYSSTCTRQVVDASGTYLAAIHCY